MADWIVLHPIPTMIIVAILGILYWFGVDHLAHILYQRSKHE